MPKLNIENPRQCPFSKSTQTKYDLVGPNYTPVPAITMETFNICIGEDCMLYHYDPLSDTEVCTLGGNPYK
jgi:hypothetical protein